ncbi:MAG TPA: hypothetical protein VMH04_00650 [Candidatus Solibacter sp.]|nr:hypothetical protein [Candidatus Solibacter sp.]
MRIAVYNSAIPDVTANTVPRATRSILPFIFRLCFFLIVVSCLAAATDWSVPEQQLARKIVAITGPGAVSLSVENRSSLSRRDNDIVQNGLRSALEGTGLRFVKPEQSAANLTIFLSENASSYVWVAQIQQGGGAELAVVIVSTPRAAGGSSAGEAVPLSLRKTPLWAQESPILDVAVLEEGATPVHLAVLDAERVSLYRMQGGRWQQEQAMEISHARPWPRDLRGRLIPGRDHLLDVYLPGVLCHTAGSPPALSCRESDDPWPLVSGATGGNDLAVFPSAGLANGASTVVPRTAAFFAPTRNFFTGVLTPAVGKFAIVPHFYSAALVPREKYSLWLFATTDGQVHMVDGISDQTSKFGWGSDIANLKTSCGAGWQVLATGPGISADSVRAHEFPDRDPVAVSSAVEFPGAVTALWTEARSDSAVAVVRNRETGSYEAYRLAVACSQ